MKIESTQPALFASELQANKNIPKNDTFDKMLDSVLQMNDTQVNATSKMQEVLAGTSDDTHGALIELEKADFQMQFYVTTRDKLIQGYQTIINMQI